MNKDLNVSFTTKNDLDYYCSVFYARLNALFSPGVDQSNTVRLALDELTQWIKRGFPYHILK